MTSHATSERYKNHRFPGEIISHGVWLYYRFTLSYRDVEELLFERGITVSHEAIRKWCRKFGQQYANQLRRRRPRPGDKWHLDEVFLTIHGERHYHAEGCTISPVAYIEGWYVDPDLRRRKVGSQLVFAAEEWAKGQGFTEIASDTQIENAISITAHTALGYAEVDRIVCFRKRLDDGR